MNKFLSIFYIILCTLILNGCIYQNNKIHDIKVSVPNNTEIRFNAFQDETYIWEDWYYSTNKVNKLN